MTGVKAFSRFGILEKVMVVVTLLLFTFIHTTSADTVVTPASGGTGLCVGGGYVTLGDITVKEGVMDDFEDGTDKKFILVVPSANFEFEPGVGSVQLLTGSGSILHTTAPIQVTSSTVTINFSKVGHIDRMDGFIISGLRIRAVTAASSGDITRLKVLPPPTTDADMRKNQPNNNISHGSLSSTVSAVATTLTSSDGNNTICAGEQVTFTASATGATTYEFFVNGVSVQIGTSATFVTASLTNGQSVTARAFLGGGCSATLSNAIISTVLAAPTVSISSNDADNTICAGETITFTAAPAGLSSYQFMINGVAVQTSATNTFTTSTLSHGQKVSVQATNSSACSASSSEITIAVNPLPVVTLTSSDPDNIICQGEEVTFTAQPVAASNYEFFIDGLSAQTGPSNQFTTATLSHGQVLTVRVTTTSNCVGTSGGIAMQVRNSPPLTLSSNDADNTICAGETVTFTATSATATSFEFFVNNVSRQHSTLTTFTSQSFADGDVISVKATTNHGCTATNIAPPLRVKNTSTISLLSSDDDNSLCAGQPVTFTGVAAEPGIFEFMVNGTVVQNSASATYTTSTLANNQTVAVRLTNSSNCTSISNTIPVTVYKLPSVSLSSSDADNSICSGETVTFTATSDIGVFYEFLVDGLPVQYGNSNTYTTNSLTNGQNIQVRVQSADGCTTTSTSIVTTVTALPAKPVVSISSGESTFCQQGTNSVTLLSSAAAGNQWFKDGILLPGETNQSITLATVSQSGRYTVRETNANTCQSAFSDPADILISASPLSTLPVTANSQICEGTQARIHVGNSQAGINYELYQDNTLLAGPVGGTGGTISLLTGILAPGNYTVEVKAINPFSGCSTVLTNTATVTVSPLPVVTLTGSNDNQPICPGESVTFTANATNAASYAFFIDGVAQQNGPSGSFTTATLLNNQVVTVEATSSASCKSKSNPVTVNVIPLIVTLSSSDSNNQICAGETVTFTANASVATVSTYEFFVNGTSVQSGSSPSYSTSTLTNGQTVTVRATTASGCSATSSGITTFVTVLTASLSSSDADNTICQGEAVTFTADAPTATTYEFFVNGVSVQNSATNLYTTPALTNGQTVTVRATTASGCSATSSGITTTVNALPTVNLSSSDADNTICQGEQVIFMASSATAVNYEFFLDGVSRQNGASNQFVTNSLTNGQAVKVVAKNTLGCTTASNNLLFTVSPVPVIQLSSNDADNTICPGETVTFTANASVATVSTYEFFVNGTSVQSGSSPSYSTSTLTNGQTVTVRATTASGCSATSSGITTFVTVLTASLSSSDADNTICQGEAVTFTADAPTATTYEFFVNGVSVQNSATNLYTTPALTNGQTVTVRATTASGCSATSSGITTTVNALPTVNLSSSDADNTICQGEQVIFMASSATAVNYEFFLDGVSRQNGASNQFVTNSLTNGQAVRVLATTSQGCIAFSPTITTVVHNLPIIILSSSDKDNVICPGEPVTFTGYSPTATTYEFFVDDVSVQRSGSNSYTTNTLTNGQTVKVRATSANDCSATSANITTSVINFTVSLTSSDPDNTICPGEEVTFSALSGTATNYEFFVNGVSVQNGTAHTFTTKNLTNGQIVYVRASSDLCSSVSNSIATKVVALTSTLSSSDADNRICQGEVVTFTADAPTATTFEFFVDGVSRQKGSSKQYVTSSLSDGQTIWVVAQTTSGCIATSNSIVTMVQVINPVLNSSDPDNTICPGDAVTFTTTINPSVTAESYEFMVNGVAVQNSASNSYTSSTLTHGQTVTVRVISTEGCIASSSGITTTVNALPTVSLSSSDTDNIICQGEQVTFTASSATAVNYEFFVNGVSVQNSATNLYTTPALSNGQTVTVKVSTASGCSASSTGITTTVNALPTVSLSSSDTDNIICQGEQVTFTASSATANNYKFYINGSLVQDGAFPTFVTSSLTNGQTVTVRATTASGCSTTSSGITTTVNALPIVSLSSSDADNTICQGEQVTFTASSATAVNYEFFIDGVSMQNSATNLYTTTALTNGQIVTVRATTASGCSVNSSGITTTVNALPTVSLSSSDADNIICQGEQVTFTASSATAVNYEFFVDGVSVQNSATNLYTTTALTNGQIVTVRATTASGCSATSSGITTMVNALPTVSLSSSDTDNIICQGEQVTFTASSATANNYKFYINGSLVQDGAFPTFVTSSLTNGQTVTVRATTASGCSTTSSGITTTVNALPIVSLSSSDADNTICQGEQVTFTASSATAVNYEFFIDGVSMQNSATNLYTTTALTNGQTVTVRATTASGCSISSSGIMTMVNALPTVSLSSSDADNTICQGEQVTFTASSATAVNYEFFVDGVSVQNTASNKYSTLALSNGQVVTVRATTASGCSVKSSGIMTTVNALPTVSLSSSDADNIICQGEAVTFTASSATSVNYEFFVDGVSVQNTASNKFITSGLTNGQTIQVLVTTATACQAVSNPIQFQVNPVAFVDAGIDQVVCEGSPIVLAGSSSLEGKPIAVVWSGGLGTFSDIHLATATYTPAPSEIGKAITLTLTTSDPDGAGPCSEAVDQVKIQINSLPAVLFSGLGNGYCIDAASSDLIGFPAGGVFTGPGIDQTGDGKTIFHPGLAGVGTHRIRYTYTDGNSCTNYFERSVVVHPLPTVSYSGFNSNGPGGSSQYAQDAPPVSLTGVPTGGIFSGKGISGNVFNAAAAGPGTHLIRYTYGDENGCINYFEKSVTVLPLPDVGIGAMPESFCSKDPDYLLIGTPSGGTFSGPGVIAGTSVFRPSNAFIGANTIRYTYKDPVSGGTNFIEKTITVYKVPDVTYSGLNPSYCIDAAPAELSGFPADNDGPGGVVGVFKGHGIFQDSDLGAYFFNPSAAGTGTHKITYVFTNENGCTDSTSKQVTVFDLPMVTFSGLENQYCIDASSAKLIGFPLGGSFNGPGISGTTFIASLAGPGTHTVTYTYTNSNGCTSTQQQQVTVFPVPVADFRFANLCDKEPVSFSDNTPTGPSGRIRSWEWNFGDPVSGAFNTSDLQNPTHLFTAPGTYNVSLKVISEYGCESTKFLSVTIGSIPEPDFTWASICLGDAVTFTHQSAAMIGNITQWQWSFGDGTEQIYTSGSEVVNHRYATSGRFMVTLRVRTNFGCTNAVSKEIYILPSVSSYPYFENFESTDGGWIEDGILSSWQHGVPSGPTINKAASGVNAWITGLEEGYNMNEKSSVYSPCFDFSNLRKPMISMNIWNHTQQGFDGAVLQSSIDGGVTWHNVGSMGEGINWYNQSAIIGNPGNQAIGQQGWSGIDDGWQNAKFALDHLKGYPSVRFRIAFGSNNDNPPNQQLDGFAFDDVYIGERDRTVLLEHFTNTASLEANIENTFIDSLSRGTDEVVSIQYHTNFPGTDALNADNPADPSARALFYGVPQSPRTAIDGYINNQKFSAWGVPVLSRRKLTETAFAIDLDFPSTPDQTLAIRARITALLDVADTLTLHIAVVEKQVVDLYAGAPVFTNVLRKMLPNAAGTIFTRTWLPGESYTVEQTWQAIHIRDASQVAVIAFIQNNRTKEIYQAAIEQPSTPPSVITGLQAGSSADLNIALYPNPASQKAFIVFDQIISQEYTWAIYDLLGRKIDQGMIGKGEKAFSIDTSSFVEGSYLIQITGKNKTSWHKKLVVLHK